MSLFLEGVPGTSAGLDEGNGGSGSEGVVGVRQGVLEPDGCEQLEAGVLGVGAPPLKLECK